MIKRKQGLSAIITTLIIVLLALVAVGIIWVVISNVIDEGVTQVDLSSKCLKIDVKAVSASCVSGICNVTLTRNAGGEAIAGVKIVFYDGTTGGSVTTRRGNTQILGTALITGIASGLTAPNSVKVSPYFIDDSGNEEICPQQAEFNF
ncbi:MAG: hypothetical protein KJ646_00590 [Nanoarchaeota archaeon]|nr:hypothetical protein [Nanoarchaeota archaeon]MBU4116990.1 hypothetical protein [Nanoarchaeota archaeon]